MRAGDNCTTQPGIWPLRQTLVDATESSNATWTTQIQLFARKKTELPFHGGRPSVYGGAAPAGGMLKGCSLNQEKSKHFFFTELETGL